MPLAFEAMAGAGIRAPEQIEEGHLFTTCPECKTEQSLAEAGIVYEDDGLETLYLCKIGCGTILIVSTPGVIPWEGRGYRIGDWVIRNPRDLYLRQAGLTAAIQLPASPHALD
jgi:hypothetical protein